MSTHTTTTGTRPVAQTEARADEATSVPGAEEFDLAQEQEGLGKRIWRRVAPPIVQEGVEQIKEDVRETRERRQERKAREAEEAAAAAAAAAAPQQEAPSAAPVTAAPMIVDLSDPAQARQTQQRILDHFANAPAKLGLELRADPALRSALKVPDEDAARLTDVALGTHALNKFAPNGQVDGNFGPMSKAMLGAYNSSISRPEGAAPNVPQAPNP